MIALGYPAAASRPDDLVSDALLTKEIVDHCESHKPFNIYIAVNVNLTFNKCTLLSTCPAYINIARKRIWPTIEYQAHLSRGLTHQVRLAC